MAGLGAAFGLANKNAVAQSQESALKTRNVMAIAFVALAGPSLAHHSFATFDSTQTLTLQGAVKEFQWTNPHCFIQILIMGEDDVLEEWSVEMNGPADLYRKGWRPGSLEPGDKVTLKIHPVKNGTNGGSYVSAIGPDGKPLFPDKSPP